MAGDGPQKILFVGGAPRSGTTVAHALICTSAQVSNYHPEISFFRGITQSYRNGRLAWSQHTSAFFEAPETFRQVMRETADVPMRHLWSVLGRAPILAMKDPLLTPFFPDLHALYPSEAVFVVTVRHPFEVVRSRQEVHERATGGRPFLLADAVGVAREYLATYHTVFTHNFGRRMFAFRYEDLGMAQTLDSLARFIGVDDLDPSRMWGDAPSAEDDAWGSPKYNKPIDLAPRFDALAPELREPVAAICQPIMQRFGYR